MADPMRIRAQAQGDITTVRGVISHEMESGQRKDRDGKTIPRKIINKFAVEFNGKPVNTSDELLDLIVDGTRVGDQIKVKVWRDGEEKEFDVTIGARPN